MKASTTQTPQSGAKLTTGNSKLCDSSIMLVEGKGRVDPIKALQWSVE